MTWTVQEVDGDREREVSSRAEAEETKAEMEQLDMNVEIVPPDTSEAVEVVDEPKPSPAPKESDTDDAALAYDDENADPLDQLGESLGTDPLSILPGHMVDEIQGQPAVNKRGYAMIAERYGIGVSASIEVYPWENEGKRCVASAKAETDDGRTYSGWATASAEDGDMEDQLIELAETRALKRAVSWASGVGIVSYQELSGQLEGDQ